MDQVHNLWDLLLFHAGSSSTDQSRPCHRLETATTQEVNREETCNISCPQQVEQQRSKKILQVYQPAEQQEGIKNTVFSSSSSTESFSQMSRRQEMKDSWRYVEFVRSAMEVANAIVKSYQILDQKQQTPIALMASNSVEFLLFLAACWSEWNVLVVPILLSTKLAPATLASLLRSANCTRMAFGAQHRHIVEELKKDFFENEEIFYCFELEALIHDALREEGTSSKRKKKECGGEQEEEHQEKVEDDSASKNPQHNNVAMILHTSGTTHEPKLVPLTHQNLVTNQRACQEYFSSRRSEGGGRWDANTGTLLWLPLYHGFGLTSEFLRNVWVGGCTYLYCPQQEAVRPISAKYLLQGLRDLSGQVHGICVVPFMLSQFREEIVREKQHQVSSVGQNANSRQEDNQENPLRHFRRKKEQNGDHRETNPTRILSSSFLSTLQNLSFVLVGGAVVSDAEHQFWMGDSCGGIAVRIENVLGMTETAGSIMFSRFGERREDEKQKRKQSTELSDDVDNPNGTCYGGDEGTSKLLLYLIPNIGAKMVPYFFDGNCTSTEENDESESASKKKKVHKIDSSLCYALELPRDSPILTPGYVPPHPPTAISADGSCSSQAFTERGESYQPISSSKFLTGDLFDRHNDIEREDEGEEERGNVDDGSLLLLGWRHAGRMDSIFKGSSGLKTNPIFVETAILREIHSRCVALGEENPSKFVRSAIPTLQLLVVGANRPGNILLVELSQQSEQNLSDGNNHEQSPPSLLTAVHEQEERFFSNKEEGRELCDLIVKEAVHTINSTLDTHQRIPHSAGIVFLPTDVHFSLTSKGTVNRRESERKLSEIIEGTYAKLFAVGGVDQYVQCEDGNFSQNITEGAKRTNQERRAEAECRLPDEFCSLVLEAASRVLHISPQELKASHFNTSTLHMDSLTVVLFHSHLKNLFLSSSFLWPGDKNLFCETILPSVVELSVELRTLQDVEICIQKRILECQNNNPSMSATTTPSKKSKRRTLVPPQEETKRPDKSEDRLPGKSEPKLGEMFSSLEEAIHYVENELLVQLVPSLSSLSLPNSVSSGIGENKEDEEEERQKHKDDLRQEQKQQQTKTNNSDDNIDDTTRKRNGILLSNRLMLLHQIAVAFLQIVPFQSMTSLYQQEDHTEEGRRSPQRKKLPTLSEIKKLVFSRQGGLCYVLNIFMGHLLQALGFDVYFGRCTIHGVEDCHVTVFLRNLEVVVTAKDRHSHNTTPQGDEREICPHDIYQLDVGCGYVLPFAVRLYPSFSLAGQQLQPLQGEHVADSSSIVYQYGFLKVKYVQHHPHGEEENGELKGKIKENQMEEKIQFVEHCHPSSSWKDIVFLRLHADESTAHPQELQSNHSVGDLYNNEEGRGFHHVFWKMKLTPLPPYTPDSLQTKSYVNYNKLRAGILTNKVPIKFPESSPEGSSPRSFSEVVKQGEKEKGGKVLHQGGQQHTGEGDTTENRMVYYKIDPVKGSLLQTVRKISEKGNESMKENGQNTQEEQEWRKITLSCFSENSKAEEGTKKLLLLECQVIEDVEGKMIVRSVSSLPQMEEELCYYFPMLTREQIVSALSIISGRDY